jgi:hypothetical protein
MPLMTTNPRPPLSRAQRLVALAMGPVAVVVLAVGWFARIPALDGVGFGLAIGWSVLFAPSFLKKPTS